MAHGFPGYPQILTSPLSWAHLQEDRMPPVQLAGAPAPTRPFRCPTAGLSPARRPHVRPRSRRPSPARASPAPEGAGAPEGEKRLRAQVRVGTANGVGEEETNRQANRCGMRFLFPPLCRQLRLSRGGPEPALEQRFRSAKARGGAQTRSGDLNESGVGGSTNRHR